MSVVDQLRGKLRTIGTESVLRQVNQGQIGSSNGSLGVMIYDLTGIIRAWSTFPTLLGPVKGRMDLKGRNVMEETIQGARAKPRGWYRTEVIDPFSGGPGFLVAHYQLHGELIVSCGFFETAKPL